MDILYGQLMNRPAQPLSEIIWGPAGHSVPASLPGVPTPADRYSGAITYPYPRWMFRTPHDVILESKAQEKQRAGNAGTAEMTEILKNWQAKLIAIATQPQKLFAAVWNAP